MSKANKKIAKKTKKNSGKSTESAVAQVLNSREFVRGAARFHDLVYVITRDKNLNQKDIAHTSLLGIDRGQWGDAADAAWNSTAIAVARLPEEKTIAIGEDGDVITYVGGKSTEEKLMPQPLMIRNAREIGGYVYACGMKRQVYRRAAEQKWVDISAPIASAKEEAGFEAIDGYSEKEIYAAGWSGEIWHYDGKGWKKQESPTKTILTAVCCASDGVVYIAGQGGVLIKGKKDSWEVIKWKTKVTEDLWDLCWYKDKLYVATMSALYTLKGNSLLPVDMGKKTEITCYSLTTAEGVLWSIGQDNAFSFDGSKWQRYK